MANYQSVTVQETTEEENVSLEKQAAMQDEAAEQRNQSIESTTEEPQEETQEERPEWLDEKFESPEDLAKAYKELQKKQSKKAEKEEPAEEEAEEQEVPTAKATSAVENATEEFAEKGELSDKTFVALEKAGIPRHFVEAYMAGQESISTSQSLDIQNEVGGNANYNAMSDWAAENLSDGDVNAFNSIVETGSVEQAKMAVKGLYSQYISAGGQPPELSQGGTSGSSVKPFGSAAQVTEAMRDPRYGNDPAFRETVEKRLAVSNVL
jgi:actin-related protein